MGNYPEIECIFASMTTPVKKGDFLEGISLLELSSEGPAIARIDNFVVFVEGGVPGDLVDVEIYNSRKNFAEARITRLVKPSPDRTTPACEHFGTCGGCKWQQVTYARQLVTKQQMVEDALIRIGKLDIPAIRPILASEEIYAYRNRLDYACADRRWLTREEINSGVTVAEPAIGFHVPARFDRILNISSCHLQADLSNQIRNEIRGYAIQNGLSFFNPVSQEGFLRNVIVRSTSTGEWMVIVVFHYEDETQRLQLLSHVQAKFPSITSLLYIINTKRNDTIFDLEIHCFNGRDHLFEEMEGLKFKISAKSFYQTNSKQAYELYKIARSFAGLTGKETVYDLYTGTGTIAQFVSRNAKFVAGIDNVPDAIADAVENAGRNGIKNVHFTAGDLKNTLNADFIKMHGRPEVVITDPPRSGMHPEVVKTLCDLEPLKIVYVSCNPSTQARDLQELMSKYKIGEIQPVDMFPHTTHVENVVSLDRTH